MRGTAPLLVALAAPLLGEILSPALLAGVILIGAGVTRPVWLGIPRGAVARSNIGVCFAGLAFFTTLKSKSDNTQHVLEKGTSSVFGVLLTKFLVKECTPMLFAPREVRHKSIWNSAYAGRCYTLSSLAGLLPSKGRQ